MEILIGIVIILIILGAISGGEGLFDSLSKGCGCIIAIVIVLLFIVIGSLSN